MEENKTKQEKQERTVIHLYLKNNDTHHYFGSMANVFEHYSKENIGITFGSLRNYGLSSEKPYENKMVIIRKGILQAKPKKSNNKKSISTDIDIKKKEQSPVMESNTSMSSENEITEKLVDKKRKLINLDTYLSNDKLFSLKSIGNNDYMLKKNDKNFVKEINQWCSTKNNDKGEYTTRIYKSLSKICGANKEMYNNYIDKINAKVSKHNVELKKL